MVRIKWPIATLFMLALFSKIHAEPEPQEWLNQPLPQAEPVNQNDNNENDQVIVRSSSRPPRSRPINTWRGNEWHTITHLDPSLIHPGHRMKSSDLDADGNFHEVPMMKTNGQNQTLVGLRKFRQLKSMILYMTTSDFEVEKEEPGTLFGKFCWYGCWCFIEGSTNLQSGYGRPRDEVDAACMRFSKCYRCLAMDYKRFNENIAYRYSVDDHTRTITCSDPEGTMKRNLCECDKELASELKKHEHFWQVQYHEKWSNFDRRHECYVQPSNIEIDMCCGKYPHRYPFSSNRGQKACCINKVYSVDYFKCAKGEVVELSSTK